MQSEWLSPIQAGGYCFAAAVASILMCPEIFPNPTPQYFTRQQQHSYDQMHCGVELKLKGGARYAGRKRNSRATKTGSRRLVFPMVGVGAGRQQSTPPNRL